MSWDKRWMRRAFGCAAADYDRLAELQRQIGERLLGDFPDQIIPGWVVDLGAGTGWCAVHLGRRYPDRPQLVLDIAEGMLQRARLRILNEHTGFVTGDMEVLPLATGSAGLVISNLALQWCLEPQRALAEMARVLKPCGQLLLTTFVSGTLEELRQAWSRVDDYTHINEFITVDKLEACLAEAGFRQWKVTVQTVRLGYDSLLELFHDLKGIGAHNVTSGRPRHLMGKGRLRSLEKEYPGRSGRIAASFVPASIVAVR